MMRNAGCKVPSLRGRDLLGLSSPVTAAAVERLPTQRTGRARLVATSDTGVWRLRSSSSKNEFDAICFLVAAGAMAPDYFDKPVKYRRSFVFQRISQVVFN
jgi:hypothetical protein